MNWDELKKQWNSVADGTHERAKPRHTEDQLQIACLKWLTFQYPQYAELIHHSPNGGARSKVEGAIFKMMGVKAGFPDLFLYAPVFCASAQKWIHGLAIEMKTEERGSRQSDAQKHWQQLLTSQGYQYTICRTLDEFIQTVTTYIHQSQKSS